MIKKPKQNDLPTSFENEAELQNVIRENKKFFNAFYSAELKKTQFAIIREAVSGSTFRAYRGGKYEPSSVYRTWHRTFLKRTLLLNLLK